MIDLHVHTTASDGTLDPIPLVKRAHDAGVRTLSVTDHDTMSAVPTAAEAASRLGMDFFPGIEVTAVLGRRDVHVLGYFLDTTAVALEPFLRNQRQSRIIRAQEMAKLLDRLGVPIDVDQIIAAAESGERSVGRPALARALVDAGHASSPREAFQRWIGDQGPAYVAREGLSPVDVVRPISRAGGVSALAHPGLLRRDDLIPEFARAGITAIEVYHPEHDTATQSHYRKLALQYSMVTSGGADFHGDGHRRSNSLGSVGLRSDEFDSLLECLVRAHRVVHGDG